MKKKIIVTLAAALLVLCCAVGGTLAWLVSSTDEVKNTFTYGDINISLWEHKLNDDGLTLGTEVVKSNTGFKMIPGNTIDKDPTITVKAGSEASWLFVEITESSNFESFMTYALVSGWTELDGHDGVYYRTMDAVESDTDVSILGAGSKVIGDKTYTWTANEVFVLPTVTKTDLSALTEETYPTLTFKAYAVQRDTNIATAADAWAIANGN